MNFLIGSGAAGWAGGLGVETGGGISVATGALGASFVFWASVPDLQGQLHPANHNPKATHPAMKANLLIVMSNPFNCLPSIEYF
jgi:hypothetical protein